MRRAALEQDIGFDAGDAASATLTAAGYNFRRILVWLRMLLRLILSLLMVVPAAQKTINPAS